jgi:hypothetical protein
MARPRVLNDLKKIKSVVAEYKKDPKPTISGLCIALSCSPNTLYSAMALGDEISDELEDAYNYLIFAHEKQLWEKTPVAHIFYLKCIKRFGYQWREQSEDISEVNTQTKFIFEIVEKKDNNETK